MLAVGLHEGVPVGHCVPVGEREGLALELSDGVRVGDWVFVGDTELVVDGLLVLEGEHKPQTTSMLDVSVGRMVW